jgi:hypothetical protein
MPGTDDLGSSISAEAIAELAESGGLCADCGGLHIGRIEVAIIVVNAARQSGVELPTCHCNDCSVCRPFHDAVLAMRTAARSPATWSAE